MIMSNTCPDGCQSLGPRESGSSLAGCKASFQPGLIQGNRGRKWTSAYSIEVQQPHHNWPTTSNLYHSAKSAKTFSDPEATGYVSDSGPRHVR